MKVLVSAIACDPNGGSENFVGWQAISAIAKDHEVWVLTSSRHRAGLQSIELPANVQIHCHGDFRPWHPDRLLARVQDWREFVAWKKSLLPVAATLHRKVQFDVFHHVTYSTWRVPSPLWKLGVPFIWGPVGGAGTMPIRFHTTLSNRARVFEIIRTGAGLVKYSHSLRSCAKQASQILVSSEDTHRVVCDMRGSTNGVSVLSPGFFSADQLKRYSEGRIVRRSNRELRIFAGGNMIGSKGGALALRALSVAKSAGLKFLYTIAGGGPEETYLRQIASELGLEEVSFVPSLTGDAYLHALRQADVYLLPSFRENIGLTMMEAMLSGSVPVVLDRSAPGEIVTSECGIKIQSQSVRQVIADLCSALLHLNANRSERERMARSAINRIEKHFSQDHYRREIGRVYENAVKQER